MPTNQENRATAEQVIAAVAASPAATLLATDFDGTLSLIVDDPDAAVPLPGAAQVLQSLASSLGELAVISGRPVEFLVDRLSGQLSSADQRTAGLSAADQGAADQPIADKPGLPESLTLVGLYGLQQIRHGVRSDHPEAEAWPERVAALAATAETKGPAGMRVELKGLSITLHYRGQPQLFDQVEQYARELAATSGLVARTARMSVELHPPIDVDKGTVLLSLAQQLAGPVIFLGDDVGDLPAFDALDTLSASGLQVFKILALSEESDDELLRRADLILDGPPAMVALLFQIQAAILEASKNR
ncbi:Trehalose-6-phosphatase [Actinobacteria bacterium IMCC26207]|nr:Trehalose-6-phosphatase [Actinobacteria bacterium IMCC26207]